MKQLSAVWAVVVGLGLLTSLVAEDLPRPDDSKIKVFHRYDLRRKVNGQYQGLVYGQAEGLWTLSAPDAQGQKVSARYYLIEQSNRDGTAFEKPVNSEKNSTFVLHDRGLMTDFAGDGVPLLRSFPLAPPDVLQPGLVWEGSGEWVVDPRGDGKLTRIPILVQYKANKPVQMAGTDAWEIVAKFALRYRAGQDRTGDPDLIGAQGTQDAIIYLSTADHSPLFIRAKSEEQFSYTGGQTLQNSGFYLTFYNGVLLFDKPKETERLRLVAEQEKIPGVQIRPDEQGVKLTLENLLFVPDQPVLLPGETDRLDRIAQLLKSIPGRSFLVTGHTAAVGSEASQLALSRQRALAIVEELKKRGIEARRLLYDGKGGSRPVADNTTETGRQLNRRVEILILED